MIDKAVEKYTRDTIFKDLRKGDPNHDIPHTESVVFHIKEIINASPDLKLDSEVLIIAAYAHD